jgi:hypothetical protein
MGTERSPRCLHSNTPFPSLNRPTRPSQVHLTPQDVPTLPHIYQVLPNPTRVPKLTFLVEGQMKLYPPNLPTKNISDVLASLVDYCYCHGLLIRPSLPTKNNLVAIPPPVTLYPSLFPRDAWEKARKLQTVYNLLYARVANDFEWLQEVVDEYSQIISGLILDLRVRIHSYNNCGKSTRRLGKA